MSTSILRLVAVKEQRVRAAERHLTLVRARCGEAERAVESCEQAVAEAEAAYGAAERQLLGDERLQRSYALLEDAMFHAHSKYRSLQNAKNSLAIAEKTLDSCRQAVLEAQAAVLARQREHEKAMHQADIFARQARLSEALRADAELDEFAELRMRGNGNVLGMETASSR